MPKICQLSPEFLCQPSPLSMEKIEKRYETQFRVEYEAGTKMGYSFVIRYTNETTLIVPDKLDFVGLTNIVEPITGSFYIEVDVSEYTDSTPNFFLTTMLTIILGSIVLKRKYRITKPDSTCLL